jgi:hypothetical protein
LSNVERQSVRPILSLVEGPGPENGTYKKSFEDAFVTKLMGKQMTVGESLEHEWIRDIA